MVTCSPCDLPQADMTISWVNVFFGNGSTTLVYAGGSIWASATCEDGSGPPNDDGLLFQLNCNGGSIELRAIFFTSGICPSGTQQYCSNLRINPLALTLSSHTCTPISFTFTVNGTNCPTLFGTGNQSFTVTYP